MVAELAVTVPDTAIQPGVPGTDPVTVVAAVDMVVTADIKATVEASTRQAILMGTVLLVLTATVEQQPVRLLCLRRLLLLAPVRRGTLSQRLGPDGLRGRFNHNLNSSISGLPVRCHGDLISTV